MRSQIIRPKRLEEKYHQTVKAALTGQHTKPELAPETRSYIARLDGAARVRFINENSNNPVAMSALWVALDAPYLSNLSPSDVLLIRSKISAYAGV
jgi:hypothetical protein